MDSLLENIDALYKRAPLNMLYGLLLLFILLMVIYFYRRFRRKKELLEIIDNKVKVFQKALDISKDGMLLLSDKQKLLYINLFMKKLFGIEKNNRNKFNFSGIKVKVKNEWLSLYELIEINSFDKDGHKVSYLQVELMISNKSIIPINLFIETHVLDSKNKIKIQFIVIHDLRVNEKYKQSELTHPLTHLPNQAKLVNDLNSVYAKLHLNKNKLAFILIDIDDFLSLQSIIGYEQINKILVRFSDYLKSISEFDSIHIYHTYYNNFFIRISDVEDEDEVYEFIKKIQKKLASFYKMKDVQLYLTASVGLSIYNGRGSTRDLLDNTYKALVQAQSLGNGRIHEFEPELSENDYDALLLHNEMHQAIEKKQFEIYYQPIVDAKTEKIVSAEALIRWNHPDYGLIPPYIFIPIMEKTGFIIEIGQYVLDEVLKQQKRWEIFQFKQIDISINITLFEIESKDFVKNVVEKLKYHNVDPSLIKFEITEGSAMISEESTQKHFKEIKKLGIGISLDDFGTGYTSFSYMKKFPADVLKIDKTMVDYILTNKEDQSIVKAMINMGHSLNMKIIVEGIENKKMFELLTSYGCDMMQGYYFAKPLPVFEFQKSLR
jgi:polar amino acid transport system substrate-binding protein